MEPANPLLNCLSREDQQQVEKWLQEFDRRWDEGRLARVACELPAEEPLHTAALSELVKLDLHRKWQQGNKKSLESYLLAYPELGTSETAAVDLIQAEMQARKQGGDSISWAELSKRFPKQTEQIRRGMEQLWRKTPTPESSPPTAMPNARTDVDLSMPASLSVPVAQEQTLRGRSVPVGMALDQALRTPLPGDTRYKIEKELGRGAMGTVYLARDTKLDRQVALKIPHFRGSEKPDLLERFRREARAAATLHHRNICPVYDVGECSDISYLTMAYVEGRSLGDRVRKQGPLPQALAVELIYKLARALAEAHRRGVIHRDLKPSNVMLDREGEPVLMDFGLARREGTEDIQLTHEGSVFGTPAYMSPEQVSGKVKEVGPLSDVYGLGVMFYELLTGQVPFQGGMGLVMARILTDKPKAPRTLRPDLDAGLEAVCLKAMATEPRERYASMAEFADALAPYLEVKRSSRPDIVSRDSHPVIDHTGTDKLPDSFVEPKPPPPPPPWPKWLTTVLGVGAALLVAGGIVFLVMQVLNKEPTPVAVTIESMPEEGATISLDGKPTEKKTPATFNLKPGTYTVRLELDKYESRSEQLVVRADSDKAPFRYNLDKKKSIISSPTSVDVTITTDPPGATVFVDGKRQEPLANNRFRLEPGAHDLRLELKNHHPHPDKITVTAGKPNSFHYDLKVITHALTVKSNPKGAKVSLNGKPRGETTEFFELQAGKTYEIEFSLPGYKSVTKQVAIVAERAPDILQAELIPLLESHQYALLVGVRSGCEGLPDFVHAESDVDELGRLLVAGGYPKDNVVVMTRYRGAKDPKLLPSEKEITARLDEMLKKCRPVDSLMVAFIGHAVRIGGKDPDSYFCPADSSVVDGLLPLREVYQQLEKKGPKSSLLLLDCWRYAWGKEPKLPAGVSRDRPAKVVDLGKPALWLSCSKGQRGYEHPDERHGLFCHALLRALRTPSGLKLPAEVQRQVERASVDFPFEKQTPEFLSTQSPDLPWLRLRIEGALAAYSRGCDLADQASKLTNPKDQLAKFREAIEAFDEATKKDPAFVDPYLQRAAVRYYCHEYHEAIGDCDLALKLDPGNATAYSHRAEALTKLKRFADALQDHQQAIARDPEYALAYNTCGQTYLAKQDFEAAIGRFSEALGRNPRLKWALCNRGRAYRQLKKPELEFAIKDQTKAVEIDRHFMNAWFERGLAHYTDAMREQDEKTAQAKYQLARNDLTQAIDKNKYFPLAYQFRSMVYRALGEPGLAAADEKTFKELTAAPKK
ncbi:MAG TPA: PEGA domain-containing protein [Gemmataceae bacterium]|nr:PEGA domain-containing protein [Gemmataceae bacterium]